MKLVKAVTKIFSFKIFGCWYWNFAGRCQVVSYFVCVCVCVTCSITYQPFKV